MSNLFNDDLHGAQSKANIEHRASSCCEWNFLVNAAHFES